LINSQQFSYICRIYGITVVRRFNLIISEEIMEEEILEMNEDRMEESFGTSGLMFDGAVKGSRFETDFEEESWLDILDEE